MHRSCPGGDFRKKKICYIIMKKHCSSYSLVIFISSIRSNQIKNLYFPLKLVTPLTWLCFNFPCNTYLMCCALCDNDTITQYPLKCSCYPTVNQNLFPKEGLKYILGSDVHNFWDSFSR